MSNSFGAIFRITGFGESHGRCMGVVVDGCPAGLALTEGDIQKDVDKRRSASVASTTRTEEDRVEIISGVNDGCTTGAPVCMLVWNRDVDDSDYERMRFLPRPGHADYPAYVKYGGYNDWRGGGRFSGRTTLSFVMAGAIARKLLGRLRVEIFAHTVEIGGIRAKPHDFAAIREKAPADPLRCGDSEASARMESLISDVRRDGDSVGGAVQGIAVNVPAGLGEPVCDRLDAELARAVMLIPGVKGVEFGAGFAAAGMKGSEHNDPYVIKDGGIAAAGNNSGGILGGISNGMPVVLRAAVKPTSSIAIEQKTVDLQTMKETTLSVQGRHDACIVPRAVAVVEAMMAVTLCDFALRAGVLPGVLK
jgi:chorismate synthase